MLKIILSAVSGGLLALAGTWLAWGWPDGRAATIAGVGGDYTPVVHMPAPGLPVRIEVYSDFTCPACQAFELQALPRLEERYGGDIAVDMRYLGNPTSESAKILHDIALARGSGPRVARQLMEAGLSRNDDAGNAAQVDRIARENGLHEALALAIADGSGSRKSRADWHARPVHVEFFPYVVIAGSVATTGDAANVSRIVDDLLARANEPAGP